MLANERFDSDMLAYCCEHCGFGINPSDEIREKMWWAIVLLWHRSDRLAEQALASTVICSLASAVMHRYPNEIVGSSTVASDTNNLAQLIAYFRDGNSLITQISDMSLAVTEAQRRGWLVLTKFEREYELWDICRSNESGIIAVREAVAELEGEDFSMLSAGKIRDQFPQLGESDFDNVRKRLERWRRKNEDQCMLGEATASTKQEWFYPSTIVRSFVADVFRKISIPPASGKND